MMSILKNKRRNHHARRGSALVISLCLAMALASAVLYAVSDSDRANQREAHESNYNRALAAAEYGAELAIANLSSGFIRDGDANSSDTVVGDWIYGSTNGESHLYENSEGKAFDQRRITGVYDGHEFRVRVRSARQVYDPGNPPTSLSNSGWLYPPENSEIPLGTIKVKEYHDIYEITSTARADVFDVDTGTYKTGSLAVKPVVQAILDFRFLNHAAIRDRAGVIHLGGEYYEMPLSASVDVSSSNALAMYSPMGFGAASNFEITGAMNPEINYSDIRMRGSNEYSTQIKPVPVKNVFNVKVSGEDHFISKYFVDDFTPNRIITPWRLTTSDPNYLGALGGYWTNGQLTLNYRHYANVDDANPFRPKTPSFGTSGDNRIMFVQDSGRPYDSYLLGGKQGRSVTLKDDGMTIVETSSSQAKEGANFNIVLGAFEDLRNLYINMAGVVGSYTDPNNWWQMYVGQYTHSRRGANGNVTRSLPNYANSRVRAQTVHLMQNKKKHKLVRLYEKSEKKGQVTNTYYYTYPVSGGTWTGMYTWLNASYGNNGVLGLRNLDPTPVGTPAPFTLGDKTYDEVYTGIPGEKSGQYSIARTFFWQELVGYELVRRKDRPRDDEGNTVTTDLNEPAIVVQRDVPRDTSKQKIDKRTMYRYDGNNRRKKAGFDEIYQAATESGSRHPLSAEKYKGAVTPGYLQDRFDSIFVYEEILNELEKGTGKYHIKEYANMNSFLFEKNFSPDARDDDPITDADRERDAEFIREALNLLIAYEDQRETTADYNYTDMMFNIYVAPEKRRKEEDLATLGKTSDHWWERDEREGLTGLQSHLSLTANDGGREDNAAPADLLSQNYAMLRFYNYGDDSEREGHSVESNIWGMGNSSGEYDGFPRAIFKFSGGKSTGELDYSNEQIMAHVQHMEDEALPKIFYYTDDDILDYMQNDPDGWRNNNAASTETWRWNDAVDAVKALNASVTLKHIDERWNYPGKSRIELEDTGSSSFGVPVPEINPRQIAGLIFGFKSIQVPAVQTERYQRTGEEPEMVERMFIAGEYMPANPADYVDTAGIPSMGYDEVPHSTREFVIPETLDNGDKRVGSVVNFVKDTPEEAVDACYRNFFQTSAEKAKEQEIQELYGLKERRYSIGFHRAGTAIGNTEREKQLKDRFVYDHYEYVSVGTKGFIPFATVDDDKFLAKNLQPPKDPGDPDEKPVYGLDYKYANPFMTVPEFVFDRPIDGAGVLLVNGDLVVRDTFAYHGILIVLGDINIIPTRKDNQPVYGPDGHPIDDDGHSLRYAYDMDPMGPFEADGFTLRDEQSLEGNWKYTWVSPTNEEHTIETNIVLDDLGDPVYVVDHANNYVLDQYGNRIVKKVVPLRESTYRGELIVQGQLFTMGKVRTEQVYNDVLDEQGVPNQYAVGKLNAYWSSAAGDLGNAPDPGVESAKRVSWYHDDTIDTSSIWTEKQDN